MSEQQFCALFVSPGTYKIKISCICNLTDNLLAARIFGPGPTMAKSLHKPAHKSSLLPSPKQSVQSAGLSRQSFASSALKRVPSSRLLQRTLQSSQHYLQNLRGASVPGLAQQAGLQNRNIGELSPKAALAHLRRPFNYVLGQSMSLAF